MLKWDHVLNTAHNYHKKRDVLGIRLDSGRSIGSIKQNEYYISGKFENFELIIGFFENPIELIYRIQGNDINEILVNGLIEKGWSKSINGKQQQVHKKQKLSKFMAQDGHEVDLMIKFLCDAINDFKEVKSK